MNIVCVRAYVMGTWICNKTNFISGSCNALVSVYLCPEGIARSDTLQDLTHEVWETGFGDYSGEILCILRFVCCHASHVVGGDPLQPGLEVDGLALLRIGNDLLYP